MLNNYTPATSPTSCPKPPKKGPVLHITPGDGYVDISATVGVGTKVWQFASIIRGAAVGANCNIASCAIIDGAQVGDGCLIGHGAQLHPGTKLGNRVFVGPGAIFCNDMWPSVSKEGFELGGGWTVIAEDETVIGAGAVILPGVRIHKGGMVAAGACVDRDVLPGMIWRRNGYMGTIPDDVTERRMWYVRETA